MKMDIDLTPKVAKKVYGGDGGSYHAWCPDDLPMLKQGNIGAAKLSLNKNGFALPCYSDSAKVAYILQGIIIIIIICTRNFVHLCLYLWIYVYMILLS